MDELVSRQVALVAVKNALMAWSYMPEWRDKKIIEAIAELSPIQPDIVRCKDCQYWNNGSCEYPEHAVNSQDYCVGDIETEAEHFCGYAERREVTT